MTGKGSPRPGYGPRITTAPGTTARSGALLACVLLLALPLSGCGGGGGGSTTTQPPATTQPPPAAPPPVEPPPEAPPPAEPPPAEPPPAEPPPPPSEPTPPEEPTPPPPPAEPPPDEPPPPPPPAAYNLTLTGRVLHAPVPFADVTARVGSQVFHAKADAEGQYSISIASDDGAALVELSATSTQQPLVDYVSLVGSISQLVTQAGAEGVLTADENHDVNITNVSTARLVLLEAALGRAITNELELQSASAAIPLDYLLELAAIVKMVVDEGATLPGSVTGVRQLISDPDAVEAFKAISIGEAELQERINGLLDPAQSPGLLPKFSASRVPAGYALLQSSNPGTLRTLTSYPLFMFQPNGSGRRLFRDLQRQYEYFWQVDPVGKLNVTPGTEAIESFQIRSCWSEGQYFEVRTATSVLHRSFQLIHRGRNDHQLVVTTNWREAAVDPVPSGCELGLPDEWTSVGYRLAPVIGNAEMAFKPSEFPVTLILKDHGVPVSESHAIAVSMFQLDANGMGRRLRWSAGTPLGDDAETIAWSLQDGRLVIHLPSGETHTYHRLHQDGRGGEGLAYISETSEGIFGGYFVSARFASDARPLSAAELIGEWISGISVARLSREEQEPFSVRLCNELEPNEENTGPLYGTGVLSEVSPFDVPGPLSWDMLSANGELLGRTFIDLDAQHIVPHGLVSYCEEVDPPDSGACRLYQQREWLPVSRDANRLYVIERLQYRNEAIWPETTDYISIRPNYYELTSCGP